MTHVRSQPARPASRAQDSKGEARAAAAVAAAVELVVADKALTSLRSSGHDYCSAIGEVIDNSLQADANNVRLRIFTDKKIIGKNTKPVKVVDRVAVGDDGAGMSLTVLHHALQLGYSSRYDDRKGMGRFGVGAKLGGISQAKRIELYSRQASASPWLFTYIDLDDVQAGAMQAIPEPVPANLPADCKDLVGAQGGTLVVWSKADRLAEKDTGRAREASTVEGDLVRYIARTFRKFLNGGINVEVNGTKVRPHDPLFTMTTTQFHEGPAPDPVATTLLDKTFDWPVPSDPDRSAPVRVTFTLLPEQFRVRQSRTDRPGGSAEAKKRRIHENEGISILRADREIFFGYLSGIQPSIEKIDIDRWWGCEIAFSPELDECFQVRNVKKGAEPIDGLRDKLKEFIFTTVVTARKQIQSFWDTKDADRDRESGIHGEAEDVAKKTAGTSPKPKAGQETPGEQRDRKIREAAAVLGKGDPERQKKAEEEIRQRPVTIVPRGWPGNELFEIEHLGDNAIVYLNMRHAFYREVYAKLLDEVEKATVAGESNGTGAVARLAQVGLDLLILSYARGEGMRPDATSYYSDLRTFWSLHCKNMVDEWKKP